MKCPNCQSNSIDDDSNLPADIAKCTACGHIFKIPNSGDITQNSHFNINHPPKGAWYRRDMNGVIVGASTRNPIALFFIPFTLIWSGGTLGGIYGTQIVQQKFNLTMSLFGLPFLIASILLWGMTLMSMFGKVEIQLNRQGGKIFTGIGTLGRKKTFVWQDLSSSLQHTTEESSFSKNNARYRKITKTTQYRASHIRFTSTLTSERRSFLLQALKYIQAQYQ